MTNGQRNAEVNLTIVPFLILKYETQKIKKITELR